MKITTSIYTRIFFSVMQVASFFYRELLSIGLVCMGLWPLTTELAKSDKVFDILQVIKCEQIQLHVIDVDYGPLPEKSGFFFLKKRYFFVVDSGAWMAFKLFQSVMFSHDACCWKRCQLFSSVSSSNFLACKIYQSYDNE